MPLFTLESEDLVTVVVLVAEEDLLAEVDRLGVALLDEDLLEVELLLLLAELDLLLLDVVVVEPERRVCA